MFFFLFFFNLLASSHNNYMFFQMCCDDYFIYELFFVKAFCSLEIGRGFIFSSFTSFEIKIRDGIDIPGMATRIENLTHLSGFNVSLAPPPPQVICLW